MGTLQRKVPVWYWYHVCGDCLKNEVGVMLCQQHALAYTSEEACIHLSLDLHTPVKRLARQAHLHLC